MQCLGSSCATKPVTQVTQNATWGNDRPRVQLWGCTSGSCKGPWASWVVVAVGVVGVGVVVVVAVAVVVLVVVVVGVVVVATAAAVGFLMWCITLQHGWLLLLCVVVVVVQLIVAFRGHASHLAAFVMARPCH